MEWLKKFMDGRTGVDHFSLALLFLSITINILGALLNWNWLIIITWGVIIYCWYRILSKNKVKRHQENILFLKYWYPIQTKWKNKWLIFKAGRQYKYFKCKDCGQKLRVPKGKGKIEITCPKCHQSFIKKS